MRLRNNILKLSGILLLLVSLMSATLTKRDSYGKEALVINKELAAKSSEDKQEIIRENFSMEAVIPFLQIVFSGDLLILFYDAGSSLKNISGENILSAAVYINTYFKNLFSFIISPNAP